MGRSLYLIGVMTIILPVAAVADPVTAPRASWSGCYIGVSGGDAFHGTSRKKNVLNLFGTLTPAETDENSITGPVGGGELGCNAQSSNIVLGAALEGWYQNVRGAADGPPPFPQPETVHTTTRSDYAGAATVRLGYSFGPLLAVERGDCPI